MASIYSVAKYILNVRGPMTAMKLQKLCYYAQAWTLAWNETPLFQEEFEAWANGPVSPDLYMFHRKMFFIDESIFLGHKIADLTNEERENIDIILESYGDKDPQWLSDLTHQERPWRQTREGIPFGEASNKVIEKELMQDYYAGLVKKA